MAHVKHLKKNKNGILIDAEFRIKVEKIIEDFSYSDKPVYEFPSALTNTERAFVHNVAPKYNLKTKSHGKGKVCNIMKLTITHK
jgi:R3H domain